MSTQSDASTEKNAKMNRDEKSKVFITTGEHKGSGKPAGNSAVPFVSSTSSSNPPRVDWNAFGNIFKAPAFTNPPKGPSGGSKSQFNFINSTVGNAVIGSKGPVHIKNTKETFKKGATKNDTTISGGNFPQANIGGEAKYSNDNSNVIAGGSGEGNASAGFEDIDNCPHPFTPEQYLAKLLQTGVNSDELIALLEKRYKIVNLAYTLSVSSQKRDTLEEAEKSDVSDEKLDLPVEDSTKESELTSEKEVASSHDQAQESAPKRYLADWDAYFTNHQSEEELIKFLKGRAFNESLRNCNFRSICWRIFLGCLPTDVNKWQDSLRKGRDEYNAVYAKHCSDPHLDAKKGDIEIENPLSQSDQSPWSQHFKNEELRRMIDRDVKRTCPELNYFHSDKVRTLLANVLFCYAREHESLSYRQGMHELLAPIVFVLYSDLQGAAHATDMGALPSNISEVLNQQYHEHDAYVMFCQVMDATNPWYTVGPSRSTEELSDAKRKSSLPSTPFQSSDSSSSSTPLAITNKLNHIHNKLLAQYDVELFQHLNRLEIIPQVYGLRWVRLLFGREFQLQDLLVLWDALFADSKSLDLVDYIFVAMMYNIRLELIAGDYCSSMQLLMKYPDIEDIFDLVHLALHYRNPKKYEKPANMQRKLSLGSSGNNQHLPVTNLKKKKILPNFKFENPFSNISINLKKSLRISPPPERRFDDGSMLQPGETSIQYAVEQKELRPRVVDEKNSQRSDPSMTRNEKLRSMSGLDSVKLKKSDEEIRQNEVEMLKQELIALQEKCVFCSDRIDDSIQLLQPYLMNSGRVNAPEQADSPDNGDGNEAALPNEKQLVALANLKQVRDMLRGSLVLMEGKPRSHSAEEKASSAAVHISTGADGWTMVEKTKVVK